MGPVTQNLVAPSKSQLFTVPEGSFLHMSLLTSAPTSIVKLPQDLGTGCPCYYWPAWSLSVCPLVSSACLPSSVVWAVLDPAQLPCLFFFFFFHQCGFICPVCYLAGPEQAHRFPAWKLHPETLSDTWILESHTLDGHY